MVIFHIWDWNICVFCLYPIPTDWCWSLLPSWVDVVGCCLQSDRKMPAASSPLASKISRTFLVLARGPGRHSTSSRSSRPKSSRCSKASNNESILSSSSSTKETRRCLKTFKQDAQASPSTMTDLGPPSSSKRPANLLRCFLRVTLGVHLPHWLSVLWITARRKLTLISRKCCSSCSCVKLTSPLYSFVALCLVALRVHSRKRGSKHPEVKSDVSGFYLFHE